MNIDPKPWGSIRSYSHADRQVGISPDHTYIDEISETTQKWVSQRSFVGTDIQAIIEKTFGKFFLRPKRMSPILFQCCLLIS